MQKRTFACLTLALACALLLAACGGSETNTSTTNTASNSATTSTPSATNTASTPATTNTPAASNSSNSGMSNTSTSNSTSSAGEKIGVPECDDYLMKYEACITGKVPAAARAQYEASMKQLRDSWRQAAATPQGKSGLAMGCKAATDQAKTSMKSFGCDF